MSDSTAIGARRATDSDALSSVRSITRQPELLKAINSVEANGSALQGLALAEAVALHWPGKKPTPPWLYTQHSIGFLPGDSNDGIIKSLDETEPDLSLKNSAVNIRLSRLRISEYPGDGPHQVLLTMEGRNQAKKSTEDVAFNVTVRGQDGQDTGVLNWPVFLGLNVGTEGVAFRFKTTNVANEGDQALLKILKSDVIKDGLKLATTAQPAIKPLTDLSLGLASLFLARNENVVVQEVYLGLDFAGDQLGAPLAVGNYIVAQVPPNSGFSWKHWHLEDGQIVRASDAWETSFIYNAIMFSVTRSV